METRENLIWYPIQVKCDSFFNLQAAFSGAGVEAITPDLIHLKEKRAHKDFSPYEKLTRLTFVKATINKIETLVTSWGIEARFINDGETHNPLQLIYEDIKQIVNLLRWGVISLSYLIGDMTHIYDYKKVRVEGGLFTGLEGYLVRIHRDRKIVVPLRKSLALVFSNVDRSYISDVDSLRKLSVG